MRALVLSGATVPYDELILAITPQIVQQLMKAGYTKIEMQYGHSKKAFEEGPGRDPRIHGFAFDPAIGDLVAASQLVISHAGTGSILDCLRNGDRKRLVVVVNEKLMDNHQIEVAEQLNGHQLLMATTTNLSEVLTKAFTYLFVPLPPPISLQPVFDEIEAEIAAKYE